MQDPEKKTQQRRQLKRWGTSMPCMILWGDRIIKGELANISFRGAFIAAPSAIPPVDSAVTLIFHYESQISLRATVDSEVVHTIEETEEADGIRGFGLEFQGPLKINRSKLLPLIEKLSGDSL